MVEKKIMNNEPRLTPDQKRIMLVLCNAAERGPGAKLPNSVRLVNEKNGAGSPIRENTTGCALVRKGLATRLPNGRFEATTEGYWLGDGLRIEDRQDKIPPRRRSGGSY